jgi:hypothetical protein
MANDGVWTRVAFPSLDFVPGAAIAEKCASATRVILMQSALVFVNPVEIAFPAQTVENPSGCANFFDSDWQWLICGNEDGYFWALGTGHKRVTFDVLRKRPAVV